MRRLALFALALACYVLLARAREFNIHCNSNLVMYWGQNSHGTTNPGENQLPLDEYCDKEAGDVLVLSFLSEFNADGLHPPTLNLANSCLTTFDNSTLLHCPNIGRAIKKCQKKGKVVILSLGGASGAYGFSDDVQAERYADQIWDMFLGGNSQNRPFDNAVIDGIDLDIEGGSSIGYVRFVQRLRERFTESPGRRFYVTAAPQCPYPDFYMGPILDNAYLDMVFVQFYNNYCGVDKANWFNFEQWHEWATTISANKDVRVYLGVPGSPSAASSGYMPFDRLEELVNATRSKFSTFGGMMVWDASQADSNIVDRDSSFVDLAKRLLDSNKKCTDDSDKVVETVTDNSSSNDSSLATVSETKQTDTETLKNSLSGSGSATVTNTNTITHSSTSHNLTRIHERTTTFVDDDGTATVLTHVDVSEVTSIDQQPLSATNDRDDNGLALEQLNRVGFKHMAVNRMAVDSSEDPAGEDAQISSSSSLSTDDSDTTSKLDGETESDSSSNNTNSGEGENETNSEAEATDSGSSDSGSGSGETSANSSVNSSEEPTQDDSATQGQEEETEDRNETTTTETTKVLFTTTTRTRKVHIVTKQVTKRVRKAVGLSNSDSFTNPSPSATTNKTTSIVTPTFPLPIARCPRADQPCIGAGFACNGYEFGQCVNNRWLMRPCSTDRVTACFNAGPDLVACDFPKGRSLQVCDDILAPLPYGRLASNVLFLRSSDQERALNTPVYPVPSSTVSATTHVKKKKDDDDDDDETDDDDDDYNYNKYGEKKKNTATSTVTDMELVKQSSGVNLIDDHNRREDPAMLMVKDPAAYFGPDGHVRVVGGNVVDDLRKHNSFGTSNEPYDENPPVDDPEEADEYSEGDEFMRKRDFGAWDEELQSTASSAPSSPQPTAAAVAAVAPASAEGLAKRDVSELVGASVSMAHLGEKPWRAQLEDFYAIYALYSAFSGISNDMIRQQFERAIMDHIDGDFIIPPKMAALEGRPMLAHFNFMPLRGEDSDYKHYLLKDGQVEEDVLVTVRMLTNIPIPKRWRIALPLPLNATMLHTSRGSFYAGDRVSSEVKSMYMQRVAFYNENIRLNTNKQQLGPELQRLNDLAAGHSSNATEAFDREFNDGPNFDSIRRNLISPLVISQILHKKPASPPPPELLDEPIANDPAGRLYEVRSDPNHEKEKSMAISFVIRVKTHPSPGKHVVSALPHPILSFITTY
ncbi:Chitinase 2 [Coemansia asiatica]|uniref:chitinase n=1 Tax=Coemansia asiatica TaxID=1052880 RepID=A0A9W7XDC4_9FUNG|nr:Chitinase 2 [Coemansia asiatica]